MKVLFFSLAALFGSVALAQNKGIALSGEDSVRSMIEALPEVKEKDHVYDSLTNRMQQIIIKITPPDSSVNYYYVEAGYQGNSRFQPHFYFYVDLPNNIIYIEDWDHGDRTTIDQWRQRRSRK